MENILTDNEYETYKLQGDTHYDNRFKNRTSIRRKYRYKHLGNCISPAHSRPSGGICTGRLAQKMINRDIELHHEIDTHMLECESIRKTTICTIVPYKEIPKLNQQISYPDNPKIVTIIKKKQEPKICHLDKIHHRLYLGNAHCLENEDFLSRRRIYHIIDFSDEGYTLPKRFSHHKINFRDSLNIGYQEFKYILNQVIKIIDNVVDPDVNILIVCNAGINRSVSICIGYAIIVRSIRWNEALKIIEESKKDDSWYNLTNLRLLRLLREIPYSIDSNA